MAKSALLALLAYLVEASYAADSQPAEAKNDTGKETTKTPQSDLERSAFRAIWFRYTDRLTRMKDACDKPRTAALIAEARRKFE
jgi:hypothetical protein